MSLSITSSTISIVSTADPANRIVNASAAHLTASGGSGQITWSIVAGSLPAGLALTADTVSGLPAARGSALITVRAIDSSAPALFADAAVTVTVS